QPCKSRSARCSRAGPRSPWRTASISAPISLMRARRQRASSAGTERTIGPGLEEGTQPLRASGPADPGRTARELCRARRLIAMCAAIRAEGIGEPLGQRDGSALAALGPMATAPAHDREKTGIEIHIFPPNPQCLGLIAEPCLTEKNDVQVQHRVRALEEQAVVLGIRKDHGRARVGLRLLGSCNRIAVAVLALVGERE